MCASARERMLMGVVMDSINNQPIPFASVFTDKQKRGTVCDTTGNFILFIKSLPKTLSASATGYHSGTFKIDTLDNFNSITFLLSPASKELDEVVVKQQKSKYSKKNNPAVDLMQLVRAASKERDPLERPYYSYDSYEKIILAADRINPEDLEDGSFFSRHFNFMKQYVDTNTISGANVMNLTMKERATKNIYRNHPKKALEIVLGSQEGGVDKAFDSQGNITVFLKDVLREVDIYQNDITIMQNRFVSPLSVIAADYYRFYLEDTISDGRDSLAVLTFGPKNPQSFGFNGKLYVADYKGRPWLKKVAIKVPRHINLNYVKNLHIDQEYELDEEGLRHKTRDIMTVEMEVMPGVPLFYARREKANDNFINRILDEYIAFFDTEGNQVFLSDARVQPPDWWEERRIIPLRSSERGMISMIDNLRSIPLFYWSEKILSILVNGYIQTGKNSKFDIGPVNTMISGNSVEGVRLRFGGMTTANLSRRWFARGYGAYGTRDHRWKYRIESDISFVDKQYHSYEYPIHGLRLEHEYDLFRPGQHYLFTNADNVFLSWNRCPNNLVTYRRLSKLSYIMERRSGFAFTASFMHTRLESTRQLPFLYASGQMKHHYDQAAMKVEARYAPGEKFYQAASMRMPINMDAPIFILTHEYSPKGLLGSDRTINKTEISFQKRFWFSTFGYSDVILKGAKIWSAVNYPDLLWANSNTSYTVQPESFTLLNPMELAMDQSVTWDITYWANGTIFNRIPLINKLKLREVVSFRGVWGSLTSKNNPADNADLPLFPPDTHTLPIGKKPYMEISAGIDNILTILRVDYVWRLTYRHKPNCPDGGFRIALHFSF